MNKSNNSNILGPPQQTIVLNRDTINKGDPKSKISKPFKKSEVQPSAVTYKTQHALVFHTSGSLQTISNVHFTTGKLPVSLPQTSSRNPSSMVPQSFNSLKPPPPAIFIPKHPAKLPEIPNQLSLNNWKRLPPAPTVKLSRTSDPLVLRLIWTMTLEDTMADISGYEIVAYEEDPFVHPRVCLWNLIGCVKALPLPMACLLGQLNRCEIYHVAVRAVDVHFRVGSFSLPQTMLLD